MNRMHWIAVGALGAGLVALLVLGWRFAIHPLDLAYAAKLDEKTQLEAKLADAKQRAAQFEKFQAEAENVRRDLEFYSRRLDEPLDAVELYGTLQALVDARSLRVSNLDVTTKADKVGERHSVELDFSADLERLGRFLDDCVGQQHIFLPNSVDITRFEDPGGMFRDTIQVKLMMDVLSGPRSGP